jgi:hypothetical protein
MLKKIETQYERLNKEINKAANEKNMQAYEEHMSTKLCIDAHLIGKHTLASFRELLTFSGALFIVMN